MSDADLQEGLSLHAVGRFAEAEARYERVLAVNPNHSRALGLMGALRHQTGRHESAIELLQRSIQLDPNSPSSHVNLGEALRAVGRLNEAEAAYRQAIDCNPRQASAWSNLSIVVAQLGRRDEAVQAAREAIRIDTHLPSGYLNLGNLLADQDPAGALAAWERAIELRPDFAPAYRNAGLLQTRMGNHDRAIAALARVAELAPNDADTLSDLSWAILESGDRTHIEHATSLARRAMTLQPDHAGAMRNLGIALNLQNRLTDSEKIFASLADRTPNEAMGWKNLGIARMKLARIDEAADCFRRAIAIDADDAEAHFNLALALLSHGDFSAGWQEYEWRWRMPEFRVENSQSLRRPWDESDLADKSILVRTEQGFGDTIQFARYLPLLAARGAKVIVACAPSLHRLIKAIPGVTDVVPPDASTQTDFDVHLLSLPRLFDTTAESIPADVPYLTASPDAIDRWRERIASDGATGLRIGLCWSGNPYQHHDHIRSCPPALFAPLATTKNVTFYSLQKHPRGRAPQKPPIPLIDHTADLTDFAETAALMCNLDLIITTDTSIPHLAGALARPTWTMLALGADWRWLLRADTTPWYPTMRLFRQAEENDWTAVVARVSEEL